MIRVETIPVGELETNCYLAWNEETREGFLVDPGAEAGRIEERILANDVRVTAVLLTHGHFDHIFAAPALLKERSVPLYLSAEEVDLIRDPEKNLSTVFGEPFTLAPDKLVEDGADLCIAGSLIRVIRTPGHTAGSVCYYLPKEKILFSGDTLFWGTYGNTGLPTGSFPRIRRSVRKRLLTLPEDVRVLPGHGEDTSIAYERRYNPLRERPFA